MVCHPGFFRQAAAETVAVLFEWHGLQNNRRIRGKSFARNKTDLADQLKEKKILLCLARRCMVQRQLSVKQVYLLLEQLLMLMRSGIPLLQALEIMSDTAKSTVSANAIEHIRQNISAGNKLSDAIAPQLPDKEKTTARFLALGERNGCLILAMERLLKQKRQEKKIRDQFVQAMIYPLFLSAVSFSVMLLLTVWVVPEFKKTYAEIGAALPLYTRMTITVSEVILVHGLSIAAVTGVTIILIAALLHYSRTAQWLFARLQLRVPILGSLLLDYFCHHFASHMRIAYQSGMPLSESLMWLPQTSSHPGYRAALKSMYADTQRGISLRQAIRNSTFFPAVVEQLISIGEHSGSLNDVLEHIEQHFAEHLETTVNRLLKMLEPAMIVLVAFSIGWIVITMYLPVFDLGYIL